MCPFPSIQLRRKRKRGENKEGKLAFYMNTGTTGERRWLNISPCLLPHSLPPPILLGSLLFSLWGPDLVDPVAAHLKWPREKEKDPAARLCSCRDVVGVERYVS